MKIEYRNPCNLRIGFLNPFLVNQILKVGVRVHGKSDAKICLNF